MNAIVSAFGCTAGGMAFGDALARVLGLVEIPLPAGAVGSVRPLLARMAGTPAPLSSRGPCGVQFTTQAGQGGISPSSPDEAE